MFICTRFCATYTWLYSYFNKTASFLEHVYSLSLWWSDQCLHSWPREIITLSSDSIAYCKSSNKSLLNSKQTKFVMMPYGIRPPGKWNEAYVNMRAFTKPRTLRAVNISQTSRHLWCIWGSFMNHLYLFVIKYKMQLWRAYILAYLSEM